MSLLPPVLHPLFVHFTEGLLPTAAFFAAWTAWRKPAWGRQATLWVLGLGLLATALTLLTGLLEGDAVEAGQLGATVARITNLHKYLALGTTGVFLALWVWLWRRPAAISSRLFLALLWAAVLLLVLVGWYGGQLVYEHGVGTPNPKP